MEKLCEEGKVSLREVTWIDCILKQGYKACPTLRGALQCLEEQVKLLNQVRGHL